MLRVPGYSANFQSRSLFVFIPPFGSDLHREGWVTALAGLGRLSCKSYKHNELFIRIRNKCTHSHYSARRKDKALFNQQRLMIIVGLVCVFGISIHNTVLSSDQWNDQPNLFQFSYAKFSLFSVETTAEVVFRRQQQQLRVTTYFSRLLCPLYAKQGSIWMS